MRLLVNAIQIAGWVIAGILVVGIILVVTDANEDNAIVGFVLDIGRFFADPFRQLFEMDDNNLQIAVNWGIAAVVYVAIAIALSTLLLAIGRRAGGNSQVKEST